MHRIRTGIVASLLLGILAGCGESTVDEGPKGFTPTDIKPLDPLADQMKKKMQGKDYTKRQEAPPEKGKAKDAEKKK